MLTNNEKEWLIHRRSGDWCVTTGCSAWCDRTEGHSRTPYCFSKSCYMDDTDFYRDAAEFEARVAALLATYGECPSFAVMECTKNMNTPCEWCKMKAARLQVEEEM